MVRERKYEWAKCLTHSADLMSFTIWVAVGVGREGGDDAPYRTQVFDVPALLGYDSSCACIRLKRRTENMRILAINGTRQAKGR